MYVGLVQVALQKRWERRHAHPCMLRPLPHASVQLGQIRPGRVYDAAVASQSAPQLLEGATRQGRSESGHSAIVARAAAAQHGAVQCASACAVSLCLFAFEIAMRDCRRPPVLDYLVMQDDADAVARQLHVALEVCEALLQGQVESGGGVLRCARRVTTVRDDGKWFVVAASHVAGASRASKQRSALAASISWCLCSTPQHMITLARSCIHSDNESAMQKYALCCRLASDCIAQADPTPAP